jgi:hypothetical protein
MIQKGFRSQMESKAKAKEEGVSWKEVESRLKKNEDPDQGVMTFDMGGAKKKSKAKGGKKKSSQFDLVIKVKDKEGQVVDYKAGSTEEKQAEAEVQDSEPPVFESENTLAMI